MRILICDDEITSANTLKQHLDVYMTSRGTNYSTDVICTPRDVLNNDTVYQLAFLDIQMNELDGISVAKILKERNSKAIRMMLWT